MTDPSLSPSQRPPLWRRLLLLFLLAAAAALGIALLLKVGRPGFPYLALLFLAAALLGLACGLGIRFLLKKRHWLVRLLSALAALFGGFFLLGFFSDWKYGFSLVDLYILEAASLIQLVVGLLAALLATLAWRRPEVLIQTSTSISPPQPVVHADPPPQPSRAKKPRLAKSSAGVRVAESKRPAARRKPKPAAGSRSRGRTASPKAARVEKSPVVRPAKSRTRRRERRRGVQFASTAEHRCPYCLEVVEPHDARGIVECKICHTLHHADCWAVTGTCQVPHLNS